MSIKDRIKKLKEEKNAIILAHFYMNDEIQEIADYVGDSFKLSKTAAGTDADWIIFAGVSFMGESAKILSPQKRVFMPDASADCPMAHMVDLSKVGKIREENPGIAVVSYINSTAEIKTYSDICVTSSNAVKIVRNMPEKDIYFIPDCNLGGYVKEQVPEKNILLCDGYCPVHHALTREDALAAKVKHPNAQFLVHPECKKEVVDLADYAGSTSGIIEFATESECEEFIIGTEQGILYELKQRNPGKTFHMVTDNQMCEGMKGTTLEDILDVLENEKNEIFVDEDTRIRALKPLERMLELA